MSAPMLWRWDGEAMVPANQRFAREADKAFTIGETYTLEEVCHRSMRSHRHYFATIADAWESLPERYAGEFVTPEHLRKRCLIEAGYRDERTIVASSKAEAIRLAAFIKPMDDFAVVSVSGPTVVVWTAKSQNTRAMDPQTFAQSKDAVLLILARMLEVSPDELRRQGQAA